MFSQFMKKTVILLISQETPKSGISAKDFFNDFGMIVYPRLSFKIAIPVIIPMPKLNNDPISTYSVLEVFLPS